VADQLDELHAQAGLALLNANPDLAGIVYDDEKVPPGATRYVRVFTHIERPRGHQGNRLRGTSDTFVTRWYCHCVGINDTSARAVAMQVRSSLLDVRPTIAGRSCDKIIQEAAQPPRRDEKASPLIVDLVQVYRLTTTG
jgi:hypothetical protein